MTLGHYEPDCLSDVCLSVLLGVGLLQQCAPELGSLCRVDEQQLPVLHWQPVIDHHLHPLSKLPELQHTHRHLNINVNSHTAT